MNKSVKDLKCLCIKNIVDTYYTDGNSLSLRSRKKDFYNVVFAFHKLRPYLTNQIFNKKTENKDADFAKFLWFSNCLFKDPIIRDVFLREYNTTYLYSWVEKYCSDLSEIDFVGFKYLEGKLFVAFGSNLKHGPKLKEVSLDKNMFDYKPKAICDVGKSCHKSIKLTIFNCNLIDISLETAPFFFDLDKGITLNFFQTLKLLGYPGLTCRTNACKEFVRNLIFKFSTNCYLHNMLVDLPVSQECGLSILKFVSSHDLNNKTHKANTKRSSLRLQKHLKTLTCLEEAELNLFGAPNKQKKSIIKNLNKNLKSLKLTFLQPISFLLYIGKKFKKLQALHVRLFANNFEIDESKYFSKLNDMNITVFRNLRRFKFFCDDQCKPCPLILNTILTILKGCHETLTHFELEVYKFDDVNEIVNTI